jgi:hypothetical protein
VVSVRASSAYRTDSRSCPGNLQKKIKIKIKERKERKKELMNEIMTRRRSTENEER